MWAISRGDSSFDMSTKTAANGEFAAKSVRRTAIEIGTSTISWSIALSLYLGAYFLRCVVSEACLPKRIADARFVAFSVSVVNVVAQLISIHRSWCRDVVVTASGMLVDILALLVRIFDTGSFFSSSKVDVLVCSSVCSLRCCFLVFSHRPLLCALSFLCGFHLFLCLHCCSNAPPTFPIALTHANKRRHGKERKSRVYFYAYYLTYLLLSLPT